jgi:cell division protein FtsL
METKKIKKKTPIKKNKEFSQKVFCFTCIIIIILSFINIFIIVYAFATKKDKEVQK